MVLLDGTKTPSAELVHSIIGMNPINIICTRMMHTTVRVIRNLMDKCPYRNKQGIVSI